MDLSTLRDVLVWSLIVNYAILLVWFVMFSLAHDAVYRLHTRWFRLSRESFDALNYGGMAVYKIGVLLLNVAPLVALLIVGRR
jgi:hypothetical protein